MTDAPDVLTAFAAGLLSFLSPCVLPLIPSFLTVLTGSAIGELRGQGATRELRRRVLYRSAAFVSGFSIVFVALGFVLSSASAMIGGASRAWGVAAGIAVIVLGLNFIFDFLKILNFEFRAHSANRPSGFFSSLAFGAAFAAGWSPCVGPILASILLVAGQGTSARAMLLLSAYSAGLALPFLLTGVFFGRLEKTIKAMSSRMNVIKTISGAFLAAIGLSMIMGTFQGINGALSRAGYALADFTSARPLFSKIAVSLIYAAAAAAPLLVRTARKNPFSASIRRPTVYVPLIVFGTACAAEAAGVFSTAGLLVSWLLYQGL